MLVKIPTKSLIRFFEGIFKNLGFSFSTLSIDVWHRFYTGDKSQVFSEIRPDCLCLSKEQILETCASSSLLTTGNRLLADSVSLFRYYTLAKKVSNFAALRRFMAVRRLRTWFLGKIVITATSSEYIIEGGGGCAAVVSCEL